MKLISYYGNEVVITNDVRKIERLKSQGFKEMKPQKEKIPETKGDVKKNGTRKRKTDTEGNI